MPTAAGMPDLGRAGKVVAGVVVAATGEAGAEGCGDGSVTAGPETGGGGGKRADDDAGGGEACSKDAVFSSGRRGRTGGREAAASRREGSRGRARGQGDGAAAASKAAVSSGGRRGLGMAADDGSNGNAGTEIDITGTAGRGGSTTDSSRWTAASREPLGPAPSPGGTGA